MITEILDFLNNFEFKGKIFFLTFEISGRYNNHPSKRKKNNNFLALPKSKPLIRLTTRDRSLFKIHIECCIDQRRSHARTTSLLFFKDPSAPPSTNCVGKLRSILLVTREIYACQRLNVRAWTHVSQRKFHWSMTRTKHRAAGRKLIGRSPQGRGCYFYSEKYARISVNACGKPSTRAFNFTLDTCVDVNNTRDWTNARVFSPDILLAH